MESIQKKNFKLSKKQLNYQNNLALITKLPSSTLPPTKLNIVLNVSRAIKKIKGESGTS